ncbi:hypothetical protein LCGC14_3116990 [marine sediment metagenome]|uniref:Uncharacterized protein n=1 Tax=marine sediment metagenome TaxID=412755 RepID=A0A0F8WSB8_9ZZZZ
MYKMARGRYKITNKKGDVRRFRDMYLGEEIRVRPRSYVYIDHPSEEVWTIPDTWTVEDTERQEKKAQIIKPKEVNKK